MTNSALGQETGAIIGHHACNYSVIETTGQSFHRSGVETQLNPSIALVSSPERGTNLRTNYALGQETGAIKVRGALTAGSVIYISD